MGKLNYFKGLLCSVFILFSTISNAEWIDISTSVEIEKTKVAYDRVNRVMFSYVHITNTSGADISGDVQLKVFNQTKPTLNHDGELDSSAVYYTLEDGSLSVGARKTIRLEFARVRGSITFDVQLEKIGFIIELDDGTSYNPPAKDLYEVNSIQPHIKGSFIVWFEDSVTLSEVEDVALNVGATIQGKVGEINKYLFLVSQDNLSYGDMKVINNSSFGLQNDG
ncbi:MAG: hypothetical protein GY928_31555 [Colwellia sp.]|nr:hypothetical protein [Colwellia sp.]